MKVVLVCNGGVSTSILMAGLRKASDFSHEITAVPLSRANRLGLKEAVILLAPQIRFMRKRMEEENPGCVVGIMDETAYGRLDVKSIWAEAQELAQKIKTMPEKGKAKMKKVKITLCCNGGVSTGSLCEKIIREAETEGFEIECKAYSSTMIDDYAEGSDVILLGPQIKYMVKTIQQRHPDIPVEAINMRDYGSMNGAKIFQELKEKYGWGEEK